MIDAAIRLRKYSAKTFAMRHSLLSDVDVLSRNGDPGNLADFKLVGGLGKGSFGAVLLVKVSGSRWGRRGTARLPLRRACIDTRLRTCVHTGTTMEYGKTYF